MSGGSSSPIVIAGDSNDENYVPSPNMLAKVCPVGRETTSFSTKESLPVVIEIEESPVKLVISPEFK